MFFRKKRLFVPLLCIATGFIFIQCRQSNEEQIKDTALAFVEAMNERNYSLMAELSSPQSEPFIKYAQSVANNLVRYETMKTTGILLEGNLAEFSVEVVDNYGNVSTLTIPLVKTDDVWKVELSNQSDAAKVSSGKLQSIATENKITPR